MYGEFANLSFPKKGSAIKEKAVSKQKANAAKIDEKQSELQRMSDEYKLDPVKMLSNLDFFRGHSAKGVPSQDIEKLKSLADSIDRKKKENEKLALIIRNLPDDGEFKLSFEELTFFEF